MSDSVQRLSAFRSLNPTAGESAAARRLGRASGQSSRTRSRAADVSVVQVTPTGEVQEGVAPLLGNQAAQAGLTDLPRTSAPRISTRGRSLPARSRRAPGSHRVRGRAARHREREHAGRGPHPTGGDAAARPRRPVLPPRRGAGARRRRDRRVLPRAAAHATAHRNGTDRRPDRGRRPFRSRRPRQAPRRRALGTHARARRHGGATRERRGDSSAASCSACRTICGPRSRRSAGTPKRSPTARSRVARRRSAPPKIIGSEARRLERLVADLLDLARLDAHEFSLTPRPVDAAEVVGEAVEAFHPSARELGVTLHLRRPGDGSGRRRSRTAWPDRRQPGRERVEVRDIDA